MALGVLPAAFGSPVDVITPSTSSQEKSAAYSKMLENCKERMAKTHEESELATREMEETEKMVAEGEKRFRDIQKRIQNIRAEIKEAEEKIKDRKIGGEGSDLEEELLSQLKKREAGLMKGKDAIIKEEKALKKLYDSQVSIVTILDLNYLGEKVFLRKLEGKVEENSGTDPTITKKNRAGLGFSDSSDSGSGPGLSHSWGPGLSYSSGPGLSHSSGPGLSHSSGSGSGSDSE